MTELSLLVKKHTGKTLVHTLSLGYLRWDTAEPNASVWPQFYRRVCDAEPSVDYAQAHGSVYAGTNVMKVLLAHQRRWYLTKKPKLTKRDLDYAVSWSNLDCGPMEGRWIPADSILVVRE